MSTNTPNWLHDLPSYSDDSSDSGIIDELGKSEDTRIPNTVSTGTRNYKCPNCGGEFNQWAKQYYRYTEDGTRQLSAGRTGAEEQQCPFCGMAKFSYDESETQEDD